MDWPAFLKRKLMGLYKFSVMVGNICISWYIVYVITGNKFVITIAPQKYVWSHGITYPINAVSYCDKTD